MREGTLKTLRKKSARTRLRNIKVTAWEDQQFVHLAEKFADGNVSEWIRFAALTFRPRARDLSPLDEEQPEGKRVVSIDGNPTTSSVY